ncbi:redox-regulated ATPase YchF [Desulfovibrio ferrophilus]|uniref:Ribosome-binding ATPase YchF n=1 Tax=Desulfovibrio ferrophilus TaxID=241368 RepID=A0A2Z6B2T9_9BACT|nr:redox-regulated ATPase YchF [Desulfovibrio ferrophilus]BBD09812.1 GTP-binding protein YchF [Desulfovibrio ferrophilus]
MGLSIGIVGLPNVGKSTLFNALTKAQNAASANYPFCTIEPNKAVVPVPDERLGKLTELVKPQRVLHSTVDFVDIAGLVKGASKGEGLGNKFLANIRESNAILHVVRCFEDDDVVHVDGSVDPARDIDVIETELIMADVQSLENRVERMSKQLKGDKTLGPKLEMGRKMLAHLNELQPISSFPERDTTVARELIREMAMITAKNVIYCCNVDEDTLTEDNASVAAVRELAEQRGAEVLKINAKMEEDFVGLEESEIDEFLESYGVTESGLTKIIRRGFHSLGLISYFTAGVKEVRAWTIEDGFTGPQAAGVIHTDFERGFIRAEVIAYDDYVANGTEAACRAKGVLRVEGKDYVVKDGDVMHFLFNV